MKCWIERLIFLMAISLTGCASDLSPFPSEFVYVVKPQLQQCSKHKIISKDPVKVDRGEWIPWEQCPDVFGFDYKDAGPVMNWIRDLQKKVKERCK